MDSVQISIRGPGFDTTRSFWRFNRTSFWRASPFPLEYQDSGIRTYHVITALFLYAISWTPLHRTFLSPGVLRYENPISKKITYLSKQGCADWLTSHGKMGFTKTSDSVFIISTIKQTYQDCVSSPTREEPTPSTSPRRGEPTQPIPPQTIPVPPSTEPISAVAPISELIKKGFNHLPDPIHYECFNTETEFVNRASRARKHIQNFLRVLNRKETGALIRLGPGRSCKGWKLEKKIETLYDSFEILFGEKFILTGKELKELNQSLCVAYDSSQGLTAESLRSILTKGSQNPEEETLARSRMISSDIVMVCQSDGIPLVRDRSQPLVKFRLYTTNAPNLQYNQQDRQVFLDSSGQLKEEIYNAEVKRILGNYLSECQKHGIKVPVISGFGLGAFMPGSVKSVAINQFAKALIDLLKEKDYGFEAVIFSTTDTRVTNAITNEAEKFKGMPFFSKFTTSTKSCLDIAQDLASKGVKCSLLNPGDPSGIPGQFWEAGHIALEEMIALFSTLIISQFPGSNPTASDTFMYQKID